MDAIWVVTSEGCGGLTWFRKSDGPDADGATPGPCTERAVFPCEVSVVVAS